MENRPVSEPPFVTIVSGLPRSGTSLMMQMLSAGPRAPYSTGGCGTLVAVSCQAMSRASRASSMRPSWR